MGAARRCCLLLVVASCAKGGEGGSVDAPADVSACTIWYADVDEDGHGDPTTGEPNCSQPAKTVDNSDDCDDKDGYRYPGATEICDGVDNDCNTATLEMCPSSCQPTKRP